MKKIAVIGAGSMSEALIAGMIENELIQSKQIYVTNNSNHERLKQLEIAYGVTGTYQNNELLTNADVVILAMKPKDANAAIEKIKQYLTSKMLIVSVLAGVSMQSIEQFAHQALPIVRAMPNTSAAIGQSATAVATNKLVTPEQKQRIKALFETIGYVTFVHENQLDAVTGLSGSGPAYIYYLIEAMEKSAVEIGLDEKTAKELIVQTLIGAAGMVAKSAKTPKQLREEVTSPGGTTEAGVKILESFEVQEAFISCIKEATSQSKRLGRMFTEKATEQSNISL